jgi:hypothetical protein
MGLLGFALTEAQYFEASGARDVFVPVEMPAQRPAGNATAAALHFYREDKEAFNQQQEGVSATLRAIWASLGESPRNLITDPATGELFSDLRLILQALDARYLIVTRHELRMASESLSTVPMSDNFENTVAKHRRVHALFAAAEQPLAEFQKVELLLGGLTNEDGLNQASERYFAATPDVRRQTFNALVAVLANHVANAPLPARREYANNTRSASDADTVMEAMASMAASIAEMKRGMTGKPESQPQKKRFYCWTHGPCSSHSGKFCQTKATGHKDEATMKNKLGGKV